MADLAIGHLTCSPATHRYEGSPVLGARQIPYPATLILNAGVAKYQGRYVMMCRNDVIFPGGMILEDSGEVKIHYGAADTVECLATAHVDDLLKLCRSPRR